jgi:hypothetical protein
MEPSVDMQNPQFEAIFGRVFYKSQVGGGKTGVSRIFFQVLAGARQCR